MEGVVAGSGSGCCLKRCEVRRTKELRRQNQSYTTQSKLPRNLQIPIRHHRRRFKNLHLQLSKRHLQDRPTDLRGAQMIRNLSTRSLNNRFHNLRRHLYNVLDTLQLRFIKEYDAIMRNGTWNLVPRPKNRPVVSSK